MLEQREQKLVTKWDHQVDDTQEVVGKKKVIQANEIAQKAIQQKSDVGKFQREKKHELRVRELEMSSLQATATSDARTAIKVKMRKESAASKEAVSKTTQKYNLEVTKAEISASSHEKVKAMLQKTIKTEQARIDKLTVLYEDLKSQQNVTRQTAAMELSALQNKTADNVKAAASEAKIQADRAALKLASAEARKADEVSFKAEQKADAKKAAQQKAAQQAAQQAAELTKAIHAAVYAARAALEKAAHAASKLPEKEAKIAFEKAKEVYKDKVNKANDIALETSRLERLPKSVNFTPSESSSLSFAPPKAELSLEIS
jgi:colicin import membrane protein